MALQAVLDQIILRADEPYHSRIRNTTALSTNPNIDVKRLNLLNVFRQTRKIRYFLLHVALVTSIQMKISILNERLR